MALVIYLYYLPHEIDPSDPRLRITMASLGYSIIKERVLATPGGKKKTLRHEVGASKFTLHDAHLVGQLTT